MSWNIDKKKIFILFGLVLILMVSVTSITYAYFALFAEDNSIVGITGDTGLELDVDRVFPLNGDKTMIPQLEEPLAKAISTDYSCVDDNGNAVCRVYSASITNNGTAAVKLDGTVSFTGIDNMPNLKWKRIKDERIVGGYLSHNATTTDTYFERFEFFDPGETKTYYFVVWIDETVEEQLDSGTFRMTVEFSYSYGAGLTSTMVPMSYMTGFTSNSDYSYYRSDTYREKIKNVYFVDYIDTTGAVTSWDMTDTSMSEAGSVMAWVKTNTSDSSFYDLYIGSNNLIVAKNCKGMFSKLTNVEVIYFDNFDTRETTDMIGMFYNCKNLRYLDVSEFDTSNVINMMQMFRGCNNIITLDVGWFDTSKVTNFNAMFYECVSLVYLDVGDWDTSNVTDMSGMFACNSDNMKFVYLDVSGWNTSKVTTMRTMFQGCYYLTVLDVSNWDTSNVTDMAYMFTNCIGLTSLDVSDWDTSNVITMRQMFCGITSVFMSLEVLDVSNWDTSKVTDMAGIFQNCINLNTLDVSKWNVSNVIDMQASFASSGEYTMNLTNLDLSKWNMASVTVINGMFQNCTKLTTTLTIKNANVTNYKNMFLNAATENGAHIVVNYTNETSSLVTDMVATKSENSNVEKGSLAS